MQELAKWIISLEVQTGKLLYQKKVIVVGWSWDTAASACEARRHRRDSHAVVRNRHHPPPSSSSGGGGGSSSRKTFERDSEIGNAKYIR